MKKEIYLTYRVSDKQMKPKNLDFTNTKERVNWIEKIKIEDAEDLNEEELKLLSLTKIQLTYSPKRYKIEFLTSEIYENLNNLS